MDMLQFLRLVQFVRNTDMLTDVGEAGVEAMLPEATPNDSLTDDANASMLERSET